MPLLVISSATGLIALGLIVSLLVFALFMAMGRLFGIPASTKPETETKKEINGGLAETQRRIIDLLERLLPHHAVRYAERRGAENSSEAIRIALEVAPEDSSADMKFVLALAELQTQLEASRKTLQELDRATTTNAETLELLRSRAVTPERVTVIASGMAVGLVLLLCAFGSLLVAAIDVGSNSSGNEETASAATKPDMDGGSPVSSEYCLVKLADGGMTLRPRLKKETCPVSSR